MISKIYFSFLLVLCFTLSYAQEEPEKLGMETGQKAVLGGLEIGDLAPEIQLTNPAGESFVLSKALEEEEVLVIFYRGYWCPVCSRYLSAFEEELSLLADRGIKVVAITPESYEYIDQTIEKTGTSISVFSDMDNQVMKDYKVFFTVTDDYQEKITNFLKADIADVNGQEDAGLPVPATYLIGKDRRIKFVHYDINYRKRASVSDILNSLE